MLYAGIIHPSQLISLRYLKLDHVNLDERGELLYIVSVLKSASNLVELVLEVTMNTLCFLALLFFFFFLVIDLVCLFIVII